MHRTAIALAAALSGCAIQTNPPAFDTKAVTITCKPMVNVEAPYNCSWEYWADHPTYILYGKDGAAVRMPDSIPARVMVLQPDGSVILKP